MHVGAGCRPWQPRASHDGFPHRLRAGRDENAIPGEERARWGSSGEHLCFTFHGVLHTHVNYLCHIFWDGKMYNGRPSELVTADEGATACAVTSAADGMLTHGVLFDIPALRRVPWLEPGERVYPEDLEAAEERQGVRVEAGDAILLRTGTGRIRPRAVPVQMTRPTACGQAGTHHVCPGSPSGRLPISAATPRTTPCPRVTPGSSCRSTPWV